MVPFRTGTYHGHEDVIEKTHNNFTQRNRGENKCSISSENNEKGRGLIEKASSDVETLEPKGKNLIAQNDFQSPRELLRRNGELLEVFTICL